MIVVCAWCGLVLSDGDEPITHGICGPCTVAMEDDRPATAVDLEVAEARATRERIARKFAGSGNHADKKADV